MADSSKLGDSVLQRVLRAAGTVTYFIAEDPSLYSALLVVYWAFDFIQTLAFPLKLGRDLAWDSSPLMRSIMTGLSPLQIVPSHAAEDGVDMVPTPADSLWAVMTAFVLAMFALFAVAVYAHFEWAKDSVLSASINNSADNMRGGSGTRNESSSIAAAEEQATQLSLKVPTWMLRLLRAATMMSIHALAIPITSALLAPLSCSAKSTWLTTGIQCWEGNHVTLLVISVIVLPLWLAWAFLMAAFLVNRTPDFTGKHNVMCASHGRVTAVMIVVKLVMCLAYTFSSQLLDAWAYVIVNVACGLAWLGLYLLFMPFFQQRWNQLQAAFACCYLTAAATAALQKGINQVNSDNGAVAFLCMLAPAAYVGYSLTAMRFRSCADRRELTTPFAVELRLRYIVMEAAERLGHGHDAAQAFIDAQNKDAFADSGPRSNSRLSVVRRQEEEQSLLRNAETESAVHAAIADIDSVIHDFGPSLASSATMNIFFAHYVGLVKRNRHLEKMYLATAKSRADQLSADCRWFAHVRTVQLQQDDIQAGIVSGVGGNRMTVARRMQYERLLELSSAQVTETRAMVLSFWEQLASKHPDLQRVQSIGVNITTALAETDATFQQLLEAAPGSATVMRLYADFLLELANDPAKGRELLTDAETIEDEQSRVSANNSVIETEVPFGGLTECDLSAESLALVKVSAEPGKLGVIVDCNSAFIKAMGYNRRELIGREMSFIVPEPIASIHPLLLERYQSTGVERVLSRNRALYYQHRAGYLVPVKANIRSAGDSFIAVMEPSTSSSAVVFFVGEQEGWRACSACKNALATLEMDPQAIKAGKVAMTDFISDMDAEVKRLLAASDWLPMRLGSVEVTAKLQTVPIPYLTTPVYIIRFRSRYVEDRSRSAVTPRSAVAEDDGDGDGGGDGDGDSDRASGSVSSELQRSLPYKKAAPASHANMPADADISLCPVMGGSRKAGAKQATQGPSPVSPHAPVQFTPIEVVGDSTQDAVQDVMSSLFAGAGAEQPARGRKSPSQSQGGDTHDPAASFFINTGAPTGPADDVKSTWPTEASRRTATQSSMKRRNSMSKHQPVRFSGAQEGEAVSPRGAATGASRTLPKEATVRSPRSEQKPAPARSEKEKGPGHAGSIASSGSGSSSTVEVLRRGVQIRRGRLEQSLTLLKRALLLVFAVIAALNIAAVSQTTSLFGEMKRNVELVELNADRVLYLNRAYSHLQSLVFAAEGKFVIPEGTEYVQAKLEKWTTNFEGLHRELYLALDSTAGEENKLYTEPSIPVEDLIPGTYVDITRFQVTQRTVSLVNVGLETVAKLRLANAQPPENITMDNNAVFALLRNGHLSVRHALNHSLMLADARSSTHATNVLLANAVVFAVAEIVLVLIVLFVMVPSVRQVIASKHLVFFTFLEVPLPTIRSLRRRVQKRVEAAQRANESEDVGIDVDLADEFDDEGDAGIAAATAALAGSGFLTNSKLSFEASSRSLQNMGKSAGDVTRDSREAERSCCACCCRRSATVTADQPTRKSKRRKYSNMQSSTLSVLLSMVWPLTLFMVYFGATFAWKQSVVSDIEYVRAEMVQTSQQRLWLGQVVFSLRDSIAYCDPDYIGLALNDTDIGIQRMEYLTDGLMYGSAAMHLRPGVQILPELAQIALVNSCVDHEGVYYNMSQCTTTFYEGLFSKGMMQGFKEFAADIRLLSQERRAALLRDPSGLSLCADPLGTGDQRHPLNNPMVDAVDQMRWRYLAAATNTAALIRVNNARQLFATFHAYDLGLTLACIAALALFYNVMYVPLIGRLDAEIKRVRQLLLLFPDEVARAVPAMVEVGRKLLQDGSSVARV